MSAQTDDTPDRPRITLEDLYNECSRYDTLTDYGASLDLARQRIGIEMNLGREVPSGDPDPFESVVVFLRSWGMRLDKKDATRAQQTLKSLRGWWEDNKDKLPSPGQRLTDPDVDFDQVLLLYRSLRKRLRGFGPAGSTKTLYLLRPKLCVAWDKAIRHGLHYGDGRGASYKSFLEGAREDLLRAEDNSCEEARSLTELEALLGCTAAELINKLYFMTFTYPKRKGRRA